MIKFFSRVDKVDDIVTSFGEPKSVGDVNRNLVRVLTSDYEVEQRTLFYRDEISPAQVENIVRQRHLETTRVDGWQRGSGALDEWTG